MRSVLQCVLSIASIVSIATVAGLRPAAAEPVTLPAGMNVPLILQHHVTAGYTPAGSPVFFRVGHDVIVGDRVLIAKDSLVTGKMAQATERGMVGRAGTMLVSVESVTAIDGTRVAVDADLAKQGRSRGAATAGWILFWGLPGLITKGVNPYMQKGDELHAVTTVATPIDPDDPAAAPAPAELGFEMQFAEHRWGDERPNAEKKIDIERKQVLEYVAFKLALAPEAWDTTTVLESLRLYRVDGLPVAEEVRPVSVVDGSALFEAWDIARYCGQGTTSLTFVGTGADGKPFHASRDLKVAIKKK